MRITEKEQKKKFFQFQKVKINPMNSHDNECRQVIWACKGMENNGNYIKSWQSYWEKIGWINMVPSSLFPFHEKKHIYVFFYRYVPGKLLLKMILSYITWRYILHMMKFCLEFWVLERWTFSFKENWKTGRNFFFM